MYINQVYLINFFFAFFELTLILAWCKIFYYLFNKKLKPVCIVMLKAVVCTLSFVVLNFISSNINLNNDTQYSTKILNFCIFNIKNSEEKTS